MNREGLFSGALGGVLGLALLKFGNPIVLDRLIEPPQSILELLFQPWPVRWSYALVLVCSILAIPVMRSRVSAPKWVLVLPLVWGLWQGVAATRTVDMRLTEPTLIHFSLCIWCFCLGLFALGGLKKIHGLWGGLLAGFVIVLWMGFEQHYGGLEATRKMAYEQPNWQQLPPEYFKRLESNRIFSSLVYPNALAAAILLLLPPLLRVVWTMEKAFSNAARAVLVGLLGYSAVACLYWSGSKSGWLIALIMILMALLRRPYATRIKAGIVVAVLAVGLAGFFVKYASYFHRGAPSVSARFEYWKAAARTALQNPIFGTGPGTFAVAYRKIKPPGAEMAQLVHNDYLEQASDSGLVGFMAYAGFILGSVGLLPLYRPIARDDGAFAVWLGVLGWALQSFVEFPLYIPALAWPALALLGWMWGRPADKYEFDSRLAS